MLRSALLWASTNPTLAQKLPRYRFVQKATRRFMPGEERQDALNECAALGARGMASTITLLGENLTSLDEADAVVDHYVESLKAIEEQGLRTVISIKPTQLGLDFGVEEATRRLTQLCEATPTTVWIDMEGSAYVDRTLDIFRSVRKERANVGLCLQSYLRRTASDLESLLPLDPDIRIVKGAYNEPESIAFPDKRDVDRSFVALAETLLKARRDGGSGTPVLATHDPRMIAETNRLAQEMSVPLDGYEFSMLFGIQRAEQDRLARAGHGLRVLVSYGSAWFPWYMRRLAERPANLWFVAKQMIG
jgi:proline dehydrogenase